MSDNRLPPLPEPAYGDCDVVKKDDMSGAYTADQMREDRRQIVELCVQQIPTDWLDPLLTGKGGMGQPPYYCPDIERLLSKLAERLRSLLADTP